MVSAVVFDYFFFLVPAREVALLSCWHPELLFGYCNCFICSRLSFPLINLLLTCFSKWDLQFLVTDTFVINTIVVVKLTAKGNVPWAWNRFMASYFLLVTVFCTRLKKGFVNSDILLLLSSCMLTTILEQPKQRKRGVVGALKLIRNK